MIFMKNQCIGFLEDDRKFFNNENPIILDTISNDMIICSASRYGMRWIDPVGYRIRYRSYNNIIDIKVLSSRDSSNMLSKF